MKRLILAAASAAALAACAGMPSGEAAAVVAAAVDQPVPAGMDYVRMAGASDLYEIQSSQILLQSSQDQEMRRFAQMMIDHHTQTTATVMAAARAADMSPPPPALDDRKAQMIRELQTAQGPARDQLYRTQQTMAHQEALTLHSGYAKSGDTPQLKGAASAAVPIVSRHYNELAEQSQGHMGAHGAH